MSSCDYIEDGYHPSFNLWSYIFSTSSSMLYWISAVPDWFFWIAGHLQFSLHDRVQLYFERNSLEWHWQRWHPPGKPYFCCFTLLKVSSLRISRLLFVPSIHLQECCVFSPCGTVRKFSRGPCLVTKSKPLTSCQSIRTGTSNKLS